MRLRAALLIAAFVSASAAARAEEVYVCDGGRLVYVKPGMLEDLKRTDPCIAAYYGVEVAPPADRGAARPALRGSSDLPGQSSAASRPSTWLDPARRGYAGSKLATALASEAEPSKPATPAAPSAPAGMHGEGYREIRILNAAAPEASIYLHDR